MTRRLGKRRRRRVLLAAVLGTAWLRGQLGSWWAVLALAVGVVLLYGLVIAARRGALRIGRHMPRGGQWTAVYVYRRWWSRQAGYVGITNSPARRHAQHRAGRRPFTGLGTYRRVRWYPTRWEALNAEVALTACRACGGLEPTFNVENACWHDGHYLTSAGREVRAERIAA